eukprot:TRINITY_DN551_c0_g4_i1.p2 TRINITY_DN551_c0_g4~~TRINITY_DN551_c0_g4_i1.p2  ORF type:complete len:108 (+),score=22.51 TRINITY_DN551_c0_g4_i1:90-413(+)
MVINQLSGKGLMDIEMRVDDGGYGGYGGYEAQNQVMIERTGAELNRGRVGKNKNQEITEAPNKRRGISSNYAPEPKIQTDAREDYVSIRKKNGINNNGFNIISHAAN